MVHGHTGSNRVNRGGSWNNDARNVHAANRNNDAPGNRNNNLGFRLASSGQRTRDTRRGQKIGVSR
ncbi:MAG TPA: SUMF1/EgtB/PvdO family nonheme iron enzyme [Myxococcota bacterium]|nr:SUMF1/EgtB/PvdO family nonheme iron enzyme [Myxococcota bacterium]